MTSRTDPGAGPRSSPPGERLHALDAVRAFALLSGVVLHSALAYVMPPGQWGVGVMEPDPVLGFFVFYTHDFRMQLFFLLAGFFGARVVERRGARAYLRDRAHRIGLVFLVLVYPLKLVINMPWIAGGLKTGWLRLPPETAPLPLAAFSFDLRLWPGIVTRALGPAVVAAHAMANALTLGCATLGWIGLFVDRFGAPSRIVRYLADASCWVYLAHLPIAVALQVWVVDWGNLPLQFLTINAVTFGLTLASYDLFVRDSGDPVLARTRKVDNPVRSCDTYR